MQPPQGRPSRTGLRTGCRPVCSAFCQLPAYCNAAARLNSQRTGIRAEAPYARRRFCMRDHAWLPCCGVQALRAQHGHHEPKPFGHDCSIWALHSQILTEYELAKFYLITHLWAPAPECPVWRCALPSPAWTLQISHGTWSRVYMHAENDHQRFCQYLADTRQILRPACERTLAVSKSISMFTSQSGMASMTRSQWL